MLIELAVRLLPSEFVVPVTVTAVPVFKSSRFPETLFIIFVLGFTKTIWEPPDGSEIVILWLSFEIMSPNIPPPAPPVLVLAVPPVVAPLVNPDIDWLLVDAVCEPL